MLGVALLVFREVLEAALIVTVVAAATRGVPHRRVFIGGGVALGIVGAGLVALCMNFIEGSLGGSGQELFEATVLLTAVVMIGWHVTWMSSHGKEMAQRLRSVSASISSGASSVAVLLVVVALAVMREGSEIALFLFGLAAGGAGKLDLTAGVPLGLGGGVALGFVLYFGLLRIPMSHFFRATNWMLVLLAAGLSSSAAAYLIQADWLPALGNQLWDTSWLLSNSSLVGQALHVLVGYEARPAGMQLVFWAVTFGALLIAMRATAMRRVPGVPGRHPPQTAPPRERSSTTLDLQS
jgi:high-affinity iron transporter